MPCSDSQAQSFVEDHRVKYMQREERQAKDNGGIDL